MQCRSVMRARPIERIYRVNTCSGHFFHVTETAHAERPDSGVPLRGSICANLGLVGAGGLAKARGKCTARGRALGAVVTQALRPGLKCQTCPRPHSVPHLRRWFCGGRGRVRRGSAIRVECGIKTRRWLLCVVEMMYTTSLYCASCAPHALRGAPAASMGTL
jgi:hypothetical protein